MPVRRAGSTWNHDPARAVRRLATRGMIAL
jgi:hypothetical protein